ncbi:MAG: flagellar hook-basal body complex protein, partial [Burkholderiaceae bacterium]
DPTTYNKTTAVTVYDAGGNGYLATVYYRKTQVATPTDATNKWQTYVYIGDTKLQERLIQSTDKNSEKQYVNKYGEIRSESAIPPQDIARGVTKLFNLDDLRNPVASSAANVPGGAMPLTLTNEWKNSITFPTKVTSLLDGGESNTATFSLLGATDLTFNDGTTTYTGTDIDALQASIAADDASHDYTTTISGTDLIVTSNDANLNITTPTLSASTGVVGSITPVTTAIEDISFDLNVDGASAPVSIDLSYLSALTAEKSFTGVEMAREISNAINKAYGDQRYFDFTSLANATDATTADLFSMNVNNSGSQTISLNEPDDVADLSKMTIEDAVVAIQAKVDEAYPDADNRVTVGYDVVKQSFTFKSASEQDITLKSATLVKNDLFHLTASPVNISATTGTYGESVLPNGLEILDAADQRYGVTVTFDEANNNFSISSGSTGDSSSISISNASSLASTLFGFQTTDAGAETPTSATPLRGISSAPAVVSGNAIGINLDNKFRVDASNNQFVVTVDNVTGLITMPIKADYNIEEFRDELQNRINALADSFGRTVNGVKVEITDITGTNNKQFKITTGTTGDNSFLKVSANSIWGLANVDSSRGTTSRWLEPPQAQNEDGFPLYVDRDGQETSDPGTFSEDETRELWSPIFLDKGELTFDTGGNLKSPVTATEFNSTTIGNSGATLQFSIDYGSSTQFSSPFSVLKQDQNGRPEGDLIGVDIADDGLVSASYSNGNQKSLAKIVLVNFAAPTGLRQIGDSSYYSTSKSGDAKYGEAGAAGFGTVRAGARERANVDLTTELVELITAQRNFQANAKAIETNNTLTQAIINIRS